MEHRATDTKSDVVPEATVSLYSYEVDTLADALESHLDQLSARFHESPDKCGRDYYRDQIARARKLKQEMRDLIDSIRDEAA